MATKCNVSRNQFRTYAEKALPDAVLAGLTATPKVFSSGGYGWNYNGKSRVLINGTSCDVQIGVNATVVKSKETPEQGPAFIAANGDLPLDVLLKDGAAIKKEFSTGSLGWNFNAKTQFAGYTVQVGMNVTLIGSKELPASTGVINAEAGEPVTA